LVGHETEVATEGDQMKSILKPDIINNADIINNVTIVVQKESL